MKTEEDEAFDELAKRQGSWGGGYQAKRQMAMDKYSGIVSDGGLDPRNKMDAQPAQEPPSEWAGIKAVLNEYGLQAIDFVADFKAALARPAQEPVTLEQEREAFEAWYDRIFVNKGHAAHHKFSDRDAYCIDSIQNQWEGWKERAKRSAPPAAQRQPLTDVIKAAEQVLEFTEIAHRPPVRDPLEVGSMVRVRLHALADLHDAIAAYNIGEAK